MHFQQTLIFFVQLKWEKRRELFETIEQLLHKTQQKITNQVHILLYNIITVPRFLTGLFLFKCKPILTKNA